MTEAPCVDVGTIMSVRRSAKEATEDFFQITRITNRGTVELRQVVADQNGNPVASAFVAPPATASVTVAILPDRQAVVWATQPTGAPTSQALKTCRP